MEDFWNVARDFYAYEGTIRRDELKKIKWTEVNPEIPPRPDLRAPYERCYHSEGICSGMIIHDH